MNKVLHCAVVARRQVYESSFWTSKDVYETFRNRFVTLLPRSERDVDGVRDEVT